ncbi:hypothetical protein D3C85_1612760 [compost metagenome]
MQGEHCVADVSGTVNLGQINFLREYNSYFDQILWSDPKVPAALYGYLWDGLVFRNNQVDLPLQNRTPTPH